MVNVYENNLRGNQVWETAGRNTRCRVIADADYDRILGGRTLIFEDFNTYSLLLNVDCVERQDSAGLETLNETHNLICDNESGKTTRPTMCQ